MHVVSRKKLLQVGRRYAILEEPLDAWYRVTKRARWASIVEVRADLATADAVGKYTVFNIKGNNFRLIAEINYRTQMLFIRDILSYKDYDKGAWKK